MDLSGLVVIESRKRLNALFSRFVAIVAGSCSKFAQESSGMN
jgi:hypothetical protein